MHELAELKWNNIYFAHFAYKGFTNNNQKKLLVIKGVELIIKISFFLYIRNLEADCLISAAFLPKLKIDIL